MKTSFSILLTLCFCVACGQKKLPTKEVKAVDDTEYSYTLLPKQDSLRWYNPGLDTFKVTVRFDKISKGFPLPDVITEHDNALDEYQTLKYTPLNFSGDNIVNPLGWTFTKNQLTNVAHYKNTLSSIQTDGWVELSFNGHKVEYWAEELEGNGIAGVSIDKGPETMVDLYSAEEINNSRPVFIADSLDNNAVHVIRVRYTGQRNPNSNNSAARINLDKLVTYWSQETFYPPTKTTTTKKKK